LSQLHNCSLPSVWLLLWHTFHFKVKLLIVLFCWKIWKSCNPSYSRSRDWEGWGSRLAWAKNWAWWLSL
jgi:hypothetical protein